jgi:hypothetical protein
VPPPQLGEYPMLGSQLTARLWMCRPETIAGRKLHALMHVGMLHWRPKDLNDLRLLLSRVPPPFAAQVKESWVALLDAHRKLPPPSVRDRRADVPAELDRLLVRTLAKEPDQRPANVREVAEGLAAFSKGHDLPALLAANADLTKPPTAPVRPVRRRSAQQLYSPAVLTNSTGMQLPLIPPGTFLLGSAKADVEDD